MALNQPNLPRVYRENLIFSRKYRQLRSIHFYGETLATPLNFRCFSPYDPPYDQGFGSIFS
jgi:hypothetical protein